MAKFSNPPGFEHSRAVLPNGMAVCCGFLPGLETASVQLWVRAGSASEGPLSGCGVSHFAEHMLFKGAAGLSASEMSMRALRAGAEMNAYTWYDRTVFYADLPLGGVAEGLSILSDMAFRANLDEGDFESERSVILREIDMCADDPSDVLFDAFASRAFLADGCRHPVIGRADLLRSLSCGELRGYVRGRYRPQNMFLSVVSGLPADVVLGMASDRFASEPARREIREGCACDPPQTGPRRISLEGGRGLARGIMGFRLPPRTMRESAALDLLSFALSGTEAGVLQTSLKYGEAVLESVSSDIICGMGGGVFAVEWTCLPKNAPRAAAKIMRAIDSLKGGRFGAWPFDSFSRRCRCAAADLFKSASSLASKMGELEMEGLDFGFAGEYAECASSLSASDAARAAEMLEAALCTTAEMSPPRRLRSRPKPAAGPERGVVERALPNGARIILCPGGPVGKAHFRLASLAGPWSAAPGVRGALGLAVGMLSRGAGKMGAEDIFGLCSKKGIAFFSSLGNNTACIASESLPGDWKTAFGLLRDAALRPLFERKTFLRERALAVSRLAEDLEDPYEAGLLGLRRRFFGADPLSVPPEGEPDSLGEADIDGCAAAARSAFAPSRSVLAVCGRFDPDEVGDAAGEFMESLPDVPSAPLPQGGVFDFPRGEFSGEFGAEQCAVFAAHPCPGVSDARADLVGEAVSEIFGGSAGLAFEAVREERGLAYSAGAASVVGISRGLACEFAMCPAGSAGAVLDIFAGLCERAACGGFGEGRLEGAKETLKNRAAAARADPSSHAMLLAMDALFGRGVRSPEEVAGEISSISGAEAAEFAAKYMLERMTFVLK